MNEIKKPWITGTSLLLAALLVTACGGGGGPNSSRIDVPGGEDPRTPEFCDDPEQIFGIDSNGILPADGATDVALNSVINLRFTHNVDAASVNETTLFITNGGTVVPVNYQVNGRNVTLTPQSPLVGNTEYTINVGADIATALCLPPKTPKFISSDDVGDTTFTTGTQPDSEQPTIVSITPADGATLVPQDASVTIVFSEPVKASTVSASTISMTQDSSGAEIAGNFDVKNEIVVFTPSSPLQMQQNYSVSVSTNIRDLADNALQDAGASSFRTGGVVVALNDTLVSQIPGLSDLINGPLADLLTQIGLVPDEGGGVGNLDNLAIITLPLPTDINNPTEFDDLLVAVCDPENPAQDCALKLNVGLDPASLQTLADELASGDPQAVLDALTNALVSEDGALSVDLSLLEDGLPGVTQLLDTVPGLGDALDMVVGSLEDGLSQVPMLNDLIDQLGLFGDGSVVDLGLLSGSLLSLGVGDQEDRLLDLQLLDPSTGALLNIGGGLLDDVLDPVLDALDPVLDPVNELLCNTIPLLCLRR
jgi:hypothetical protein